LLLIIARFLSVWAGTPFPIDLVTSDSMSPTLLEGDVVAWTPARIEDIKEGDVVVFKSYIRWPDQKILVHRVLEIKKSGRGELLLMTKGDKNPWTDQEGPHIPEPYIREDHLMGKVISIGQTPLKIPFVGILGIWINQGLDIISQPTASQESVNYIGIFAPLTISVVILVILLFVIPEKAKTIKEKIRLYIFGSTLLKLKKTFILFLVGYTVFLTMIHAFAYDSETSSVGINDKSVESGVNFGRIQLGKESFPQGVPVINPSTMPVKGFIFGRGNMSKFVTRHTFQLERGETTTIFLKAKVSNTTQNGTYVGKVAVYSSPFWLIYPDDFMNGLYVWNPEATVFILDFLSAMILTTLTMALLVSITFIENRIAIWMVDRSWCHPSRLIFKKDVVKGSKIIKKKIRKTFGKAFGWTMKIDFFEKKEKESNFSNFAKPILASLFILPLLFLISDQMTAMILSVIIGGVTAYLISCKLRRKILFTALVTMTIATIHMIIQSHVIILAKYSNIMELLAISSGVIGVYLLVFTLLLIPLAAGSWAVTRLIRNVKEQRDPLLSLEGSCDL